MLDLHTEVATEVSTDAVAVIQETNMVGCTVASFDHTEVSSEVLPTDAVAAIPESNVFGWTVASVVRTEVSIEVLPTDVVAANPESNVVGCTVASVDPLASLEHGVLSSSAAVAAAAYLMTVVFSLTEYSHCWCWQ